MKLFIVTVQKTLLSRWWFWKGDDCWMGCTDFVTKFDPGIRQYDLQSLTCWWNSAFPRGSDFTSLHLQWLCKTLILLLCTWLPKVIWSDWYKIFLCVNIVNCEYFKAQNLSLLLLVLGPALYCCNNLETSWFPLPSLINIDMQSSMINIC